MHKESDGVRRRVQKTGGVSLSVTLPKNWTEKQALNAGDEVIFQMDESGALCICAASSSDHPRQLTKEIEITSSSPQLVTRTIVASYLAGTRTLSLRSDAVISKGIRESVKHTAASFIGCEVMESEPHLIILQDLSASSTLDVFQFLRRINKIVQSMLSDVFKGLKNADEEYLATVKLQEPSVDKLYYMISRQLRSVLSDLTLASTLGIELKSVIDLERIAKRLEGIADHCKALVVHAESIGVDQIPSSDFDELTEYHTRVFELLKDIMRAFFSENVEDANLLIEQSHDLRDKIVALRNESAQVERHPLFIHAERVLERVSSYIADIGEATINVYT